MTVAHTPSHPLLGSPRLATVQAHDEYHVCAAVRTDHEGVDAQRTQSMGMQATHRSWTIDLKSSTRRPASSIRLRHRLYVPMSQKLAVAVAVAASAAFATEDDLCVVREMQPPRLRPMNNVRERALRACACHVCVCVSERERQASVFLSRRKRKVLQRGKPSLGVARATLRACDQNPSTTNVALHRALSQRGSLRSSSQRSEQNTCRTGNAE